MSDRPAADFTIKRHDRLPLLTATLKGADDEPVNLALATCRVHLRELGGDTIKINAPCTVLDDGIDPNLRGRVEYEWTVADTDAAEFYELEFEVTFSSGKEMTFPNDGFKLVHVTRDIS